MQIIMKHSDETLSFSSREKDKMVLYKWKIKQ